MRGMAYFLYRADLSGMKYWRHEQAGDDPVRPRHSARVRLRSGGPVARRGADHQRTTIHVVANDGYA